MIILDVVKNNYIQYEDTQCKHRKQLFIHVQVLNRLQVHREYTVALHW